MQDFRNLKIWQKSHLLAIDIYKATQNFPKSETFGLTSQIRRAAVSVPSNIAEGCGRGSDADFCRFVQMAMGSSFEVDYQLLLSRDLGLLTQSDYDGLFAQVCEVKRMLNSLLQKLKANS
ncbi:four helix bundle protein [bacterium]|nr:MAG: four helix bundle protein [bacterium]